MYGRSCLNLYLWWLHTFLWNEPMKDRILLLLPWKPKYFFMWCPKIWERIFEAFGRVLTINHQSSLFVVTWRFINFQCVQIMGSFDGWSQGEHLSPEYDGSFTKFTTTLMLRPGRYNSIESSLFFFFLILVLLS